MNTANRDYYSGDLFGEYYLAEGPAEKRRWRDFVPGLLLAGTVGLAAAFLAGQYAFPVMLLGLLLGLALSFAGDVDAVAPGLDLASKRLLQVGIALLGLQVGVSDLLQLGWTGMVSLFAVMAGTLLSGILTARWIGEGREAGLLAGGATAICGASAALALYGVIGKERLDQARFSVTLVGVALASAIAMSFYPAFAKLVELTDTQAGFLIGASVHDAAQAIGGGYSYSDSAGAAATVTKLARVAMLGPIVALAAIWLAQGEEQQGTGKRKRISMPWFVAAFIVLAVIANAVTLPEQAQSHALDFSKAVLLLAVIATAMRSRLSLLLEAGWRPLVPVAVASLVAFLLASTLALTVIA
ncbi:YeiH family protein [Aurantiacibacter sp. D1-12]|uniref:YeiH family protein n=1 Tax=Aurantiacibacter sp. D1-12 TaxID=2993658 RepID=UPI00237CEDDE|nr:putative sulfate exporter family transporter [Aurantiacibacter sp. D1-12]MDE1467099.1 putative sulfate exporter family transporter [Aurantiacibacter sp. D1-12]